MVAGACFMTRNPGREGARRLCPVDNREDDEHDADDERSGDDRGMPGVHGREGTSCGGSLPGDAWVALGRLRPLVRFANSGDAFSQEEAQTMLDAGL
jgi:hypothetical protein